MLAVAPNLKDITEGLSIDWTVFDSSEVELVRKAINDGNHEHLASIVMEVSPEKAKEIEKIQQQLRPREYMFESKAQKEFEAWLSTNQNELTPAMEQEWQDRIDKEKAEFVRMRGGNVKAKEIKTLDGGPVSRLTATNKLNELKGLGEKSLKKLNEAGIFTISAFKELGHEKRKALLGHIVASNFKDL